MNKQVAHVLKRQRERLRTDPAYAAQCALDELYHDITGRPSNPFAILPYAKLLCEHVAKLNALADDKVICDTLVPFSEKCFSWPVRASRSIHFRDDADKLLTKFKVGCKTIAGDSASRCNPKSKFGKVAFEVLQRIEWHRVNWNKFRFAREQYSIWRRDWTDDAKNLPPFTRKPTEREKEMWLAVVKQVVKDDLRDPEKANLHLSLLAGPSYTRKRRPKAAFLDRIRAEFKTFWGERRKASGERKTATRQDYKTIMEKASESVFR